jgi:ornithine carbamoyltransferase
MQNLVSLFDWSPDDIHRVFAVSRDLKAKLAAGIREPLLTGRVLALLFEKPSLRTRVSFETAMANLGGSSLFLGEDVGWGTRESVADFARVLGQYVDVIVCRAKSHQRVEELAAHATCAVINGLTDFSHPCQALADLFTIQEIHGELAGKKLAFVGDANNVARSLAIACGKLGVQMSLAAPAAYQFDKAFLKRMKKELPICHLGQTTDPQEAVRDADAIYTDVWASMGQEAEQNERAAAFADYQVNSRLLSAAPAAACVLHCLPARRGEEITDDVLDGPQSVVMQQAGNRLHVQKGLLVHLLCDAPAN